MLNCETLLSSHIVQDSSLHAAIVVSNFGETFKSSSENDFLDITVGWGGELKGQCGLYCGENDFVVFQKTDSLSACVILLGKRNKYPKGHDFDHLNIVM